MKHGIFWWVDSQGLPLESIFKVFAGRGLPIDLRQFRADALRAGWKLEKIAAEIREGMFLAGLNVDEYVKFLEGQTTC